ncbi:putative mannosyl-oligosaccharide 1,2-alpha-mannosidase MNS3-like protein [Tanacetum coccineum]
MQRQPHTVKELIRAFNDARDDSSIGVIILTGKPVDLIQEMIPICGPDAVPRWDTYAWAFQADQDDASVVFMNLGIEDDPTSGPIIDDIAIKKIFVPTKSKDNSVLNGDFKEGPWMFRNASLVPTN